MKVYITGATGFVGRWLSAHLTDYGHSVTQAPPSTVLSLTAPDAWNEELSQAQPDVVIHLAAVSRAADARSDPDRAIATNVVGTSILLESVARMERRPAVLLVSSAEVYSEVRRPGLLSETSPLRPRHIYGTTKVAQEAIALWAAKQQGTRVAIVRPFNHTGPGQREDFVVPALVSRVLAVATGRANEIVVGNLDVARDIGDVRDVVEAYRLIAEALVSGMATPDVYNVATAQPIVLRDLLEYLCRELSVQPHIRVDPRLVRRGDPEWIVGDANKLHSTLGWTAKIPLARTVADMLSQA